MPKWYMAEKQIDYHLINLDMRGRQHKQPDYLKINPFGKLPSLVDESTGISLFESGAILLYLAELCVHLLVVGIAVGAGTVCT